MPIQSNILFMELTGIGFKHEIANQLWSTSTELMGKLEMDAFSFANHKFPLNSNSELLKVFFFKYLFSCILLLVQSSFNNFRI